MSTPAYLMMVLFLGIELLSALFVIKLTYTCVKKDAMPLYLGIFVVITMCLDEAWSAQLFYAGIVE